MKTNSHNLTLLELVISLAIVAALSSVVLDNFADVELRNRELQTVERGEMLCETMIGDGKNSGIGDFISDMGRWPTVTVETDEAGVRKNGRNLAQLYDRSVFQHQSASATMFSHLCKININATILGLSVEPIFSDYVFPEITMQVGWNGSYFNLFNETSNFMDGWGNPWKIVTRYYLEMADSSLKGSYDLLETPAADIEIEGVVSYGADNALGGTDVSDSDHSFLFPHEGNLATLLVSLKVRDDFDWCQWNSLKQLSAVIYSEGSSYKRGEVVFIEESGKRHYYTSTVNDNTVAPNLDTSDYSCVNTGWFYGTPSNMVSADSVRVLFFAPAKRVYSGGECMEAGFFCFAPYSDTELEKKILYPPLYYCYENDSGIQTIGMDVDATSDANLDESVERGLYNANRLRSRLDWQYSETGTVPSFFRAEWLVPGRRLIYAFIGNLNGSVYSSVAVGSFEWIELKPGENHITLYLERKDQSTAL
ncbi:MAG: type II secretion system protein [Lentisphaeria bacterium]